MISIQKRFLFIHVPKTAGNSIQSILADYSEDEIVARRKHQDGVEQFAVSSKYKVRKHSTLSDYQLAMDAEMYRSLFKFAAMRNPWDRMISLYFSAHKGRTEWDRDKFAALVRQTPTLRTYIRRRSLLQKAAAKLGLGKSAKDDTLDRDIDFLMKFESLERDFQAVCERLGIPPAALPRRNRSSREHYSHYYDEQLKQLVADRFAEEIDFGGYTFDTP